jgi:hypothetical protein
MICASRVVLAEGTDFAQDCGFDLRKRPMTSKRRFALVGLIALPAMLALSGCIALQGAYDENARSQCRALPNIPDRQACMDNVARNSASKRGDQGAH